MKATGLQLSLAFFLLTIGEAFSSDSTYQWTDQETGKAVTCDKCPPGTFVAKHCTSLRRTECQACPEQHYTSHPNYLQKCRYCDTICADMEQVKQECNATHNRVCECKPDYYRDSDTCVKKCHAITDKGDVQCDRAVIYFMAHQQFSPSIFRRLERALLDQDGKKRVGRKKIRNLLSQLKQEDPDRSLLQLLLDATKKANLPKLESDLPCDTAVIRIMPHQNRTQSRFRCLERVLLLDRDGKKRVSRKKMHVLLSNLKREYPDQSLLQLLLDAAKKANLPKLERKLKKRFLKQD